MTDTIGYMAIDQYGHTYHISDNAPRKWLLDHFDRKHAEKMYADTKDGESRHIGYVVARHWLCLYRVCRWRSRNGAS